MNRKFNAWLLAVSITASAFTPFTAAAEEPTQITIPAAEAALDGVTLKDTENESAISYDADHDCILGIGEFSTITYTVPETAAEGSYDIYLEISKGGSAFVGGSTPVYVKINDGTADVPSVSLTPCSMEQMGLEGDPTYMDDMGVFRISSDAALKPGDTILIGGVAGSEYNYNDTYMSSMPAIGDLYLYPADTEVTQGYADAQFTDTAEETDESDPLSGLEIAWLGSSVTYGQGASGYSMADEIAASHAGTTSYKYAISGTTLADCKTSSSVPTDGEGSHGSYVARLNQLNTSRNYDLFIVQLSTNDATQGIPMGEISDSTELADFDTATVIGAMEYIIKYVQETWNCPVMYYTGTKYDSDQYQEMVDILLQLKEKWGIGVVDLWNNEEMNSVSEEDYALYMKDEIHPTKDGYADWWTPQFETAISDYLSEIA